MVYIGLAFGCCRTSIAWYLFVAIVICPFTERLPFFAVASGTFETSTFEQAIEITRRVRDFVRLILSTSRLR